MQRQQPPTPRLEKPRCQTVYEHQRQSRAYQVDYTQFGEEAVAFAHEPQTQPTASPAGRPMFFSAVIRQLQSRRSKA